MKAIFLPALALAFAMLSAPSIAQAQKKPASAATTALPDEKEVLWDWWFVWAGGATPSREVVYIDSLSVEKVTDHQAILSGNYNPKKGTPVDYIQADGVLISEDPKKPARITTRIRLKCATQQIMFDTSFQTFWDTDRGVVTEPASPWFDTKSHLRYSQIAKFMCEPTARTEKNLMMRADQSSDPLNTTWAAFWPDAKKPEFTTKKSREQIDAEYAATMAKVKGTLADGTANAQKRLDGFKTEEAFMAAVRKTFQAKDKKFHTLFYSMPGWDEGQITAAWGTPLNTGWEGATRVLTYHYKDTVYDQVQSTVDIIQCQGGGCGKVGETTQTNNVARTANCERTLYLRPGGSKDGPRLVDYGWKCF